MSGFVLGWAGFIAVILATAFFWIVRALKLTEFSPTILLGSLFFRNPRHPGADTAGFLLLLTLGAGLFPLLYAQLFRLVGGPSVISGTLAGIVHGLLAAAILPVFGTISASVRSGAIEAPGPMGTRWGWLTPFALAAGHGLYGGVMGAILANL